MVSYCFLRLWLQQLMLSMAFGVADVGFAKVFKGVGHKIQSVHKVLVPDTNVFCGSSYVFVFTTDICIHKINQHLKFQHVCVREGVLHQTHVFGRFRAQTCVLFSFSWVVVQTTHVFCTLSLVC